MSGAINVPVSDTLSIRAAGQHMQSGGYFRDTFNGQRLLDNNVDVARLKIKRSEEHTSELQSLMRSSYAVFCLKKKNKLYHMVTITEMMNNKKSTHLTSRDNSKTAQE